MEENRKEDGFHHRVRREGKAIGGRGQEVLGSRNTDLTAKNAETAEKRIILDWHQIEGSYSF